MQSAPGARTLIDGRWRDYFSGTGYLGLQGHPDLIEASMAALRDYGLTTGTSRGGYGEHPVFERVESAAARFLAEEASVYYVSAYLGANILLSGLRDYERIFLDEGAHYSLRLAVAAGNAPYHTFPHCDPSGLAQLISAMLKPGERPLVLSDGIFPISGEIAPAPHYRRVLETYDGAILCLDDAHALGVLGEHGRGTLEHWGMTSGKVRLYTAATLSKAMGAHGGIIAGSRGLVERLWRDAGDLSGSSPAPIPAAAAAAWALDYVQSHLECLEQLRANVRRARDGFRLLGWELDDTPVPILCLRQHHGIDLARIQSALFERDICVAHVTQYSSTPSGGALRVAIFATHTEGQIDRLLAEMRRLI